MSADGAKIDRKEKGDCQSIVAPAIALLFFWGGLCVRQQFSDVNACLSVIGHDLLLTDLQSVRFGGVEIFIKGKCLLKILFCP